MQTPANSIRHTHKKLTRKQNECMNFIADCSTFIRLIWYFVIIMKKMRTIFAKKKKKSMVLLIFVKKNESTHYETETKTI